jgi:hypothetical protein
VRRPIMLAWVAFGFALLLANFYVSAWLQFFLPQEDRDELKMLILVAAAGIALAGGLFTAFSYLAGFPVHALEEPRRPRLSWMTGIAVTTILINEGVLGAAPEFRQQLYPWSAVRAEMAEERTRLLEAARAMGIPPGTPPTAEQRAELERRIGGKWRDMFVPMTGLNVTFGEVYWDAHGNPRSVRLFWMDGRFTTVDFDTRLIHDASD